jgi:mannose-6-phosphate isomerase-like protein (cupin superfamily)
VSKKEFAKSDNGFRWSDVPLLSYKEHDNTFRNISRQVLFEGTAETPTQLRYFEIDTDGHSTLEQHDHEHLVYIVRGKGRALNGDKIVELKTNDVLHIPPSTWHQFRACEGEPLGFLCMVNLDRDRPHLPTEKDLEELRRSMDIAQFIQTR